MPMNRVMRMAPSQTSTVRAFLDSLGLKAPTPSDTASTPVSAVQPEAKARRMRKMETSCMPASTTSREGGSGVSHPNIHRTKP